MADFNDLFEEFPDYDVFSDSSSVPQFPEKPHRPRENQRPPSDYGDGFGIYTERKTKLRNFTTAFYFPLVILWLEAVFRLGTGESFLSVGLLYTALFTISISCVLTLLCTFGAEKFNRVLANIFAAALTALYAAQLVYYSATGSLFTLSKGIPPLSLNQVTVSANKGFFLIVLFVPLLVSMLVGRRMFRFKRIRISAKISLVIIAVFIHLIAFGLIYLSQFSGSDSYALYHSGAQSAAERFGLLTTQRIDLTEMIF